MEIRLFLAFELPPEIKHIVAQVSREIKKINLNVKWVKIDNIHLTIVFMGNMDSERLTVINEDMGKVCADYGPFQLSLDGIGFFPNRKRPRVVWVGLNGDLERMSRFRDDLQGPLIPYGVKKEKRTFRPHLTLGRFRKSGRVDARLNEVCVKYGPLRSPLFALKELRLIKSDLKPGGAAYTDLTVWPLAGNL